MHAPDPVRACPKDPHGTYPFDATAAGRAQGPGAGTTDCRPVRGQGVRRIRRRSDQGGTACFRQCTGRRSVAPMAAAARGHVAVVVRAGAQQEVDHGRSAQGGRAGDRAPPRARRRLRHRELPPGYAGEVGPRLRRAGCHQSGPDHDPAVGIRADRARIAISRASAPLANRWAACATSPAFPIARRCA